MAADGLERDCAVMQRQSGRGDTGKSRIRKSVSKSLYGTTEDYCGRRRITEQLTEPLDIGRADGRDPRSHIFDIANRRWVDRGVQVALLGEEKPFLWRRRVTEGATVRFMAKDAVENRGIDAVAVRHGGRLAFEQERTDTVRERETPIVACTETFCGQRFFDERTFPALTSHHQHRISGPRAQIRDRGVHRHERGRIGRFQCDRAAEQLEGRRDTRRDRARHLAHPIVARGTQAISKAGAQLSAQPTGDATDPIILIGRRGALEFPGVAGTVDA
nr:hypothetical protein [Nocardia sp. Root136]